jgi:AraC family transcriptional regulator
MSERQEGQDHIADIEMVQQYIRNHLDRPLSRDVLAGIAGYSVPHLHRIYTASTGETMSDTIRQLRLKRAGYKLRMGAVDITEVALAAGYQTHAAFGKAFKQEYGLSPSEFRDLSCNQATQLLMKGIIE